MTINDASTLLGVVTTLTSWLVKSEVAMRCQIVSDGEHDRVKSYMSELAEEERSPGLSSNSVRLRSSIVNTMTVCDIDIDKRAGKLSTDEVNKIETVLNNSCQFKIAAHMLKRNRSAHDIARVYDVTDKESVNNVKRSTSMFPTVSTSSSLRTSVT